LKNFKAHQNKVYCAVHYPADHQKVKATQVTDSISVKHATNAPKKTTEGLSTVHKGDQQHRKEGRDFNVEYQQDNVKFFFPNLLSKKYLHSFFSL
jgi:hypothetical protein